MSCSQPRSSPSCVARGACPKCNSRSRWHWRGSRCTLFSGRNRDSDIPSTFRWRCSRHPRYDRGMTESASRQRIDRVLVAIVVLAVTLRAAAVAWLSDTVPFSDGAYYHLAAQKWLADWRFPFDRTQVEYYGKLGWWPPLYPAFLSLVYRAAGANPRAVAWVQVGLGALVCVLVYGIGCRIGAFAASLNA